MNALCLRQFREADNMTDVMAALGALVNVDCPERAQAPIRCPRRVSSC